MRLDGRRRATGFYRRRRVYFNGVKLRPSRPCVMADDRRGVIEMCVTDDCGRLQVDPFTFDRIWTRRHYGRVVIR